MNFCTEDSDRYVANYDMPMSQIEAIVNSSLYCEQEIRFKCFLSPLTVRGNIRFEWFDGKNEPHYYLNPNETSACQCGMYIRLPAFFRILRHFNT